MDSLTSVRRLPAILIISFIILAVLTALAVGLPTLWLVRSQHATDFTAQESEQLTRLIILGMALGAAAASFLGALIAGRVVRSLQALTNAAERLRRGDLATPVAVRTGVAEVSTVALALDDARSALQGTLAELRREKAWIDHLLEAVAEGIVTLDARSRITYFSPGAERITGYPGEALIGRDLDEVFRLAVEAGGSPDLRPERFTDQVPNQGGIAKINIWHRSGRIITLAVSRARLAPPVAGAARLALVLRDVSAEEVMHRLTGDFLANITHEFRTPLTALAASVELLLDQLPELSEVELLDLLNSLHLGVISLQTLTDNLLEGASIEAGRFRVQPRPSDLDEIVHRAVQLMHPLALKYGQNLQVELPPGLPLVLVDPERTVQVLVNLLSNAIKYGPANAEIELRAVYALDHYAGDIGGGQRWVRVEVSDRGPGIAPDRRADLFRRFVRLEPASGPVPVREGGTGLGLSVVRAIVEAQGGQAGMEDRPGGGTVFWLTLAAAESQLFVSAVHSLPTDPNPTEPIR
jgi:two-component system phosphate regulon sensor histidine kinase PhoR